MTDNIKIGATDWGLPGAGLYSVKIAAASGLDALALKIGSAENDYPIFSATMQDFYLEDQQRYGVEFCALALNDFDFIAMHAPKDAPEYENVERILSGAAKTVIRMGIPMLQVPAFNQSEIKNEEEMRRSAECFRFLCDAVGDKGIRVASENLLSPESFKALHEMVDRPNFGLYFDSQNYHLNKGWNEAEILEKSWPLMVDQLHVKDGNGALSGSLLGEGDTGFDETMKLLASKGFKGTIILENYYDQLPLRLAGDPYELLAKDLETLRSTIGKYWL